MAKRLTRIVHAALHALSSVTGQDTVSVLGRAPEIGYNPSHSEVFEDEVSDIAYVHIERNLFEFELTSHPPLEF